ncbi:uncharacterized protein N7479_009705 [Penicillium vulpinum]|uniref:Uncharacterized protein n=1 Tax=Penicillium vulpinum TaxID=29845 RepID=A0A1V6RGB5_9EURO|nr:uncharacterized protein N7479_009705 [Penicillium vulpinum]KAJ5951292.1 hypothetical protein N7479_009705 [Penicillium vulpinum]OQE00433.1 hypothetical protein PENVUL_c052G06775 [Penicillium vulpinum]
MAHSPGTTPDGQLIVYHGELFCRVANCERRTVPFSSTPNLRAHLRRHGTTVTPTASGRMTQDNMDAVITWLESLFISGEEE